VAADPVLLEQYLRGLAPAPNWSCAELGELQVLSANELRQACLSSGRASNFSPVTSISCHVPWRLFPDRPRRLVLQGVLEGARPADVTRLREVAALDGERHENLLLDDSPERLLNHYVIEEAGLEAVVGGEPPYHHLQTEDVLDFLSFAIRDVFEGGRGVVSMLDWVQCPIAGLVPVMDYFTHVERLPAGVVLTQSCRGWTFARGAVRSTGGTGVPQQLANLVTQVSAFCIGTRRPAQTLEWLRDRYEGLL
jgi:hypothetical protein